VHAIHRPKFTITIGEHFFLDKPIHKQIVKFYFIKIEDFFFLRAFKKPRKNFGRQPLHEAFNSGIKWLTLSDQAWY
jgi:hypothetical protein